MRNFLKKITPSFLIALYHRLLPAFGAFFSGFPSRRLKVIGVTGTNGKSTVVQMISEILEGAGSKVASVSSIRFKIGEREWQNTLKMTMPGRMKLQRFLSQAVKAGCEYAIVEVTSEGIKQFRHKFIDFKTAVLTNLTKEHIEAHGGFENYRKAKAELFKSAKQTHIINLDDENADYFFQFPAHKKYGFSINKIDRGQTSVDLDFEKIRAENIQEGLRGVSFKVQGTEFNLNLPGKFNVSNALAAICVGFAEGVSLEQMKKALEKIKNIPGRLELVIASPFSIYVDYAHTPDALQKVYATLSGISNFQSPISKQIPNSKFKNPKLICVLGSCGGGRDKWKRPELGKIAAKYCNKIVLTNEDPYDEDPGQILSQIKSGISNFQFPISNLYEILDRRKAIRKALNLAKPGDVVIITGKGSEPWMCLARGRKIPWDDRQIVKEEFQKLKKSGYL